VKISFKIFLWPALNEKTIIKLYQNYLASYYYHCAGIPRGNCYTYTSCTSLEFLCRNSKPSWYAGRMISLFWSSNWVVVDGNNVTELLFSAKCLMHVHHHIAGSVIKGPLVDHLFYEFYNIYMIDEWGQCGKYAFLFAHQASMAFRSSTKH